MRALFIALTVGAFVLASAECLAQTPPDYDFTWATITHPGNPAFPGDPNPPPDRPQELAIGRGSVSYEYRIADTELSVAQWTEFVNTFAVQADFPTHLFGVTAFTRSTPLDIVTDGSYSGPGRRYTYLPSRANNGLFNGVRWRDAALYCNWLHNGKSSDPASLWGGAYDTSTWDSDGAPHTDAPTHEPSARFWIPTQDEWMKAAFWDPANPNLDGWWRYLNASDEPPVPGRPGEPGATSNAGLEIVPGFNPRLVPLGAYPDALSPWGLLDTASGNREWLEEDLYDEHYSRGAHGTGAGWGVEQAHVAAIGGAPVISHSYNFRLASAVPSPGTGTVILILWLFEGGARRRNHDGLSIHARSVDSVHCCKPNKRRAATSGGEGVQLVGR